MVFLIHPVAMFQCLWHLIKGPCKNSKYDLYVFNFLFRLQCHGCHRLFLNEFDPDDIDEDDDDDDDNDLAYQN